ncbi:predicted protein [Arabidopsis lyrata subsp. lyrata]|uniref:Predicted protein n=1 Tax=Arabidopsis lyrata subsp. lyrata TaxID=81972 RepID=D7MKW1_ARALL|nr:predicted protein [Arabidopsis lyrata subsp. lyrata]
MEAHTPSPKPLREPILSPPRSQAMVQIPATPSSRRPALERIAINQAPVPLPGDAISAGSSRMQDIEIHYLQGEDPENPFGSYPRRSLFSPEQTSNPRQSNLLANAPTGNSPQDPETQETRIPAALRLGPQ